MNPRFLLLLPISLILLGFFIYQMPDSSVKTYGRVPVYDNFCNKSYEPANYHQVNNDTSFFLTYPNMGETYIIYAKKCGYFVDFKITGIELLKKQNNSLTFRLGNNTKLDQALSLLQKEYILK